MAGLDLMPFLREELRKKPMAIAALVKKSRNLIAEEDLVSYIHRYSQHLGMDEKDRVFLKFSREEQQKIDELVEELLAQQEVLQSKDAAREIERLFATKRPKNYYQEYLAARNFTGVRKLGNNSKVVLYRWPEADKREEICDKVQQLLDEKPAQKLKDLCLDVEVPAPEFLVEIVAPLIREGHLLDKKTDLVLPLERQIAKVCSEYPEGISAKELPKLVAGFKKGEVDHTLKKLLAAHRFHLMRKDGGDLLFPGPPVPIAEQVRAILRQKSEVDWKKLLKSVQGFNEAEISREVDEIVAKDEAHYQQRGKQKFLCNGAPPPPLREQILDICENTTGMSEVELGKKLSLFQSKQIKVELAALLDEKRLHIRLCGKTKLIDYGPPPALAEQILSLCEKYTNGRERDKIATEIFGVGKKAVVDEIERLVDAEKLHMRGKFVHYGAIPSLTEQILQACRQQPEGIEWSNLKKTVAGFDDGEIREQVQDLCLSRKLHACQQGKKKLLRLGAGEIIAATDLDSLRTQLKYVEKLLKGFAKAATIANDKNFGPIYPSLRQIDEQRAILREQVAKLCPQRDANEFDYAKFVEICRRESEKLMSQNRTDNTRIWEVRERMSGWEPVFEKFLRRMEQDKRIHFIEHRKPSELKEREREGSIFDSLNGLLFYFVWRK